MRIRFLQRPRRRDVCYWLDLDNTLHDGSSHILPEINVAMTHYVSHHLNLPMQQASALRDGYWRKYGATLLGLIRHHDIDPHHFLAHTHVLPELERQASRAREVLHHLKSLPGTRILLTNAPRAYTERVLNALGLKSALHAVVCIEDMQIMGRWHPKPSAALWRSLKKALPARRHVLVEDTVGHLVAARRHGMHTAWVMPGNIHKRAGRPTGVQLKTARFSGVGKWARGAGRPVKGQTPGFGAEHLGGQGVPEVYSGPMRPSFRLKLLLDHSKQHNEGLCEHEHCEHPHHHH